MTTDDELPRGWVRVPIRDVVGPSRNVNPASRGTGSFQYIDIDALDNRKLLITSPKRVENAQAPSRARIVVRAGDVLFSLVRPYLKNIALVPAELDGEVASTAYCVLRPAAGVNSKFLFYQLAQDTFIAAVPTYGNSPPSARDVEFLGLSVAVAPVGEQARIVAQLDELLSDLDAGVAALERARANLKKYRAAVLKAAVTGDLTADWRAAHTHVEPATKLLDRTLAERRRKWEADQQARFAATGKMPPKNWQEKYPEPVKPDTGNLPELPQSWCWAKLDQLISYLRNGYFQSPTPLDSGTRLLRINAVRPMRVELSECRYLPPSESLADYFVEDGDLLFTRYNGSLDLLGVAGLVRGCTEPTVHPDKLIRVKAVLPDPLPHYIEVACNTGESRRHMMGRARTTAGQTGISGGDVREMPVPLPPLAEQETIVAEVEERLSVIAATADYIAASLKRAGRLRQSILKEAFAGRLVPQDPNDEPAAALLDRIRQARHAENGSAAVTRPRGRRKKADQPEPAE